MTGTPAFIPVYEALVKLNRPGHINEIAEMVDRKPASVSNAFNYHIARARETGTIPAVIRVQSGLYALNTSGVAANGKYQNVPPQLPTPTSPQIFEQAYITPRGTIIVRGEDGTLYKLEELDI